MSFRNPANVLPGLPLLGVGHIQGTPGNFYLATPTMAVAAIPSLLIDPVAGAGSPAWPGVTINWYDDVLHTNTILTEQHKTPGNSTGAPVPLILTECKGAYCTVSMGSQFGALNVYASTTPVTGSKRLDAAGGFPVNYKGLRATAIPVSTATVTDTLIGFSADKNLALVVAVTSGPGNLHPGTTLTASVVVKDPLGAVIGSFSFGALATAAANGTVATNPVVTGPLPDGGSNFEVDLTYTLSATYPTDSFTVVTRGF